MCRQPGIRLARSWHPGETIRPQPLPETRRPGKLQESPNDVAVSNGWVSLNGRVDWQYQRTTAENIVKDLIGVRGVTNSIAVEPRVNAADVKTKIESALKRSAEIDARRINVTVTDGRVTLTGNVHSWFERDEARRAAWAAPGVKNVEDRIAVVP